MFEFNKDAVKKRIFIVGCSRSGTTLLQTLVASHPDLVTFPETEFFYNTVGRNPFKKFLTMKGISTGFEIRLLKKDILNRLNRRDLADEIPLQPLLYQQSVNIYLSVLDSIATQVKMKKNWVEKTPLNIFNIELIEKYVPKYKIIHIVRDGREVVASIYRRNKEYPTEFRGQGIDYAIELWNKTIEKTIRYIGKENNHIVEYEKLVHNPGNELKKIGEFLNLNYDQVDLDERKNVLSESIRDKEKWKKGVKKKIENHNNKFNNYFTLVEREYINKKLCRNPFYNFKK